MVNYEAIRRTSAIATLYPAYVPAHRYYTLWISRYIATARKRIPRSIANYVISVRECSQQRGSLKDNGYIILPSFWQYSTHLSTTLYLLCNTLRWNH
ncbi:hypothetical protein [Photorhabdus sp. S14-60]|nr:hypothetical protein [Photorhabdus sp. S14-60]